MSAEHSFLRDAYARMVMIRRFEEKATEMARGETPVIHGSIHTCTGQEAIPVGTAAALRDDDRIVATYRGHGWALESGITPFELLAEICHREGGINGGRAGSLMVNAAHRRFIGENSIVGAGGPIACGVALAAKLTGSGRVVAVSFGDGAVSQGALHEAFVMAVTHRLPVIFVCENNGWAEMTPGVTRDIAQRCEGYGMAGATVDGCDVEAVRAAVMEAAGRARAGDGPSLLECKTVRLAGHYNRDIEHYRSAQDRQAAMAREPIARLRTVLIDQGATQEELDIIDAEVIAKLADAAERTLASPVPEPSTIHDYLYGSQQAVPAVSGSQSLEELTFAQAVNRALQDEMTMRPDVLLLGEDVGKPGGIFGLSRGLQTRFGAQRVLDTPIAESAILGCAVGAAVAGLRPVAEIMFADFLLVALDQLVNQAANVRYLSRGKAGAAMVVRTQQGVTPGSCAQHSQCLEALLAHIPGLRVGLPITPQDGYSMLRAAIADPDPCILFEARSGYTRRDQVDVGGDVEFACGARLLREGTDAGIITWGSTVYPALEAADLLAQSGTQVAVLNLRWLSPLDQSAIERITKGCGRILVAHEANLTGGFGAEIAAQINERYGSYLKAPVRRIAAADVRMPAAPVLQRHVTPNADSIFAALRLLLETNEGVRAVGA